VQEALLAPKYNLLCEKLNMSKSDDDQFYKQRIIKSFNKIASKYDQVAILQREVAQRLIERLDYIKLQPQTIVDLGAGTGFCSQLLQSRYPDAKLYSLDIAYEILSYAKNNSVINTIHICADAYALPFADKSVDLLFSNMMLPWCLDLEALFNECHRVLRPEGLLMFATLGPDTLKELKRSWAEVDNAPHVNSFADMHDIGDALVHAKFLDPVMDVENIQLLYPRVELILKDLKMMGSQIIHSNKCRTLISKNKFAHFISAYEQYRLDSGEFPVSCEITYGHAWGASSETGSVMDNSGTVSFPIERLRRMMRRN
jgi:malonyl-CoA O-methyltransferase